MRREKQQKFFEATAVILDAVPNSFVMDTIFKKSAGRGGGSQERFLWEQGVYREWIHHTQTILYFSLSL